MTTNYGHDVFCTASDVDWARESEGGELVLNEIAKRLSVRRGTLPGDDDYGFDLRALFQSEATAAELAAIPDRIRNEIEKDDRVIAGTLSVKVEQVEHEMTVRIGGRLGSGEAFRLVLSDDEVTVTRLEGSVL